MRKNAVSLRDLRVVRGGRAIIDGLRLDVPAGSVVGLMGPSGSGKTTLMRSIVGVQSQVTGSVEVLDAAAGSPALRHRVALRPEAQMDGVSVDSVLGNILSTVPVPR